MSLRFLLDTNVLSEPAKPDPDPGVLKRMQDNDGEIATAALVWNELLYGCYRLPPSSRRQTLERYLFQVLAPSLPILPYDERAADWHAQERARLEAGGRTPAFVDGQIGAVARARDLILVTRNLADFADFEWLVVEDWTAQG